MVEGRDGGPEPAEGLRESTAKPGQPEEGCTTPLRALHELNTERYELVKSGRLLFNHPEGTHDGRFWSLALAIYASERSHPSQKPIVKYELLSNHWVVQHPATIINSFFLRGITLPLYGCNYLTSRAD